jgi:predicted nucleotidyltransferase component of viral defense system
MKVEVNTREHFSELGFRIMPFAVENRWFAGEARILSYSLDELLGTKLRALYQRKKGRDLFDLWHAFERGGFNSQMVVRCLKAYLAHGGLTISQAEFLTNLEEKRRDPMFLARERRRHGKPRLKIRGICLPGPSCDQIAAA